MIYNTRNRSTTESHRKKKKTVLMLILKGVYSWNKIRDVKPFYKLDIKNFTLPSYESP